MFVCGLSIQEWGIIYGGILGTLGTVLSIWTILHQRRISKTWFRVEAGESVLIPDDGSNTNIACYFEITKVGPGELSISSVGYEELPMFPLSLLPWFRKSYVNLDLLSQLSIQTRFTDSVAQHNFFRGKLLADLCPNGIFLRCLRAVVTDTFGVRHCSNRFDKHLLCDSPRVGRFRQEGSPAREA